MIRHGLCDDQFARVENLLPGRPGYVGRDSELGNRLFVDAVIWKFRTGVPWRDMPTRFGAWKNIHTRFSRWAIKGISLLRPGGDTRGEPHMRIVWEEAMPDPLHLTHLQALARDTSYIGYSSSLVRCHFLNGQTDASSLLPYEVHAAPYLGRLAELETLHQRHV